MRLSYWVVTGADNKSRTRDFLIISKLPTIPVGVDLAPHQNELRYINIWPTIGLLIQSTKDQKSSNMLFLLVGRARFELATNGSKVGVPSLRCAFC